MGIEAFKVVTKDWDEHRWENSLFIIGYNVDIASEII